MLQSLVVIRRAQCILSLAFFKHPKTLYGIQLLTTSEEEKKIQFVEVNGKILLELCGLSAQELTGKALRHA